ncbi:phage tail tip lysozyme [Segnochrobactraceae bacterium EtOH-i3]
MSGARGIGGFLDGFAGGAITRQNLDRQRKFDDALEKLTPAGGAASASTELGLPPLDTIKPATSAPVTTTALPDVVKPGHETRHAYDYFTGTLGYSPAAASGIVGNFMQESGSKLDPRIVHDNGTGFGMGGWRDPEPGKGRKSALFAFAKQNGLDPADPVTQYRFTDHELKTSEAGVGKRLLAVRTPEEAATVFVDFERPSGWRSGDPSGAHALQTRINNAKGIYSSFYAPSDKAEQARDLVDRGELKRADPTSLVLSPVDRPGDLEANPKGLEKAVGTGNSSARSIMADAFSN